MAARAVPDRSAADARVCVIVPCFNDGPFVAHAVASIREGEPIETIVVDDGSSDPASQDALEGLERAGTTVIRHGHNRGVSAARGTGLEATSAPLVFPLDADDLLMEGALAALADRLEGAPDAVVCYGDYIELARRRMLFRAVPEELDQYRLAYTNEFPASALFRRATLEAVGGWQPLGLDVDVRSDWSLWLTLAEQGACGIHVGAGRPTYVHRLHGGRLTSSAHKREREIHHAVRDAHPGVFGSLREHRRNSRLGSRRKALYPLLYGIRAPLVNRRAKAALDRLGVWTLQRDLDRDQRHAVTRSIGQATERGARLLGERAAVAAKDGGARPPVIVIGCGRSGTTYVTKILEGLGVFMGARQDPNAEPFHFIRLNTAVFARAGVSWSDPEPLRARLENPRFRARAANFLRSRLRVPYAVGYLGWRDALRVRSILSYSDPWGWKDPRNTFTLPLWLELFPDARVIHVVRHGADVAGSLWVQQHRPRRAAFLVSAARKRRFHVPTIVREARVWLRESENHFPFPRVSRFGSPDEGIALWHVYTSEAERHVEYLGPRACEIRFEGLLSDPARHIRSLAEFCGVPAPADVVASLAGDADPGRAYAYLKSDELTEVAERAAALLERHGYEPRSAPVEPASGG